VTPSTSAQAVALPPTGGVSGTISFGGFPAGASGCIDVTLATGSKTSARSARPAGVNSTPLIAITVDASSIGSASSVTGLALAVPSSAYLPDGTYDALVEASAIWFVVPFVAHGGALNAQAASSGQNVFPWILGANGVMSITLYQPGFTPFGP
jgi:hypothetical protein